jgi:hypothetical protein
MGGTNASNVIAGPLNGLRPRGAQGTPMARYAPAPASPRRLSGFGPQAIEHGDFIRLRSWYFVEPLEQPRQIARGASWWRTTGFFLTLIVPSFVLHGLYYL